jgi:hypothetical protein
MSKFGSTIWGFSGPGNDAFPLKRGSKGERVYRLQLLVNRAGAGLKLDSDFGAKTEDALKKYYGVTSVASQKEFDDLYKKEAAKNYVPAKTTTPAATASKASPAQNNFKSMLDVDYSIYVDLPVFGKQITERGIVQGNHLAALKKQEALYGPFVINSKLNPKWKGGYGNFSTPTEARVFSENIVRDVKKFKELSARFEKRQKTYANDPALKAAKAISYATGKLAEKAKAGWNKIKNYFGLSGTDGLGFVDPVTVTVVVVVSVAAIAVMDKFFKMFSTETLTDKKSLQASMQQADEASKTALKLADQNFEKAAAAAKAGDAEGAKQFREAALEQQRMATEIQQTKQETFANQAASDQKVRESEAEEGGFLEKLGANMGKVVGGGVALLAIGWAWQNRKAFQMQEDESQLVKQAA